MWPAPRAVAVLSGGHSVATVHDQNRARLLRAVAVLSKGYGVQCWGDWVWCQLPAGASGREGGGAWGWGDCSTRRQVLPVLIRSSQPKATSAVRGPFGGIDAGGALAVDLDGIDEGGRRDRGPDEVVRALEMAGLKRMV